MLSNFVRWNGKRKGNKANKSRSHHLSSSFSSSLASSSVLNIDEDSSFPSLSQGSQLVELNLSHSSEEWFPKELLRTMNSSIGSSPLRAQNATNSTLETHADSSPTLSHSRSEPLFPHAAPRKKSIPAPILIPDPDHLIHDLQTAEAPAPEKSKPNVPSDPTSSSPSDDLSAVSGTTLARTLIGSSFVLSSSLRHRSGLERQDSATLPCGEIGSLLDQGRSSPVLSAPPPRAVLVPLKPNNLPLVESGTRTQSTSPVSGSYITPPEMKTGTVVPRRSSRTKEIPSQSAPTSTKDSHDPVQDTILQPKVGSVPARPRVARNAVFDVPNTAPEVSVPLNIQEIQPQEMSPTLSPIGDHSLDEFDFVPPDAVVIVSPGSDSSASYDTQAPKYSGTHRGQWKRRGGRSIIVRNGSKYNSPAGGLHAMRSATISEHDYGELVNYDLTVSSESSASAGYQTFPETPVVFTPLWSPGFAFHSKSDSEAFCRHPSAPKSAGLGPGRPHPSMRIGRRQFTNNSSTGGPVVSSLPGNKAPPPKESNLPPSAQVNDKTTVPSDTAQSSIANTKGSQNSAEPWSAAHSHPLAHISYSSSCLPEEEALLTLAPRSSSSLPSVAVDDPDASLGLMAIPVPILDPSAQSPTSTPLPESTAGSPFNSPALVGSETMTSPSTSPLQSSIPASATTASQSPYSSSSSAAPSSSLWGSSFLPSSSPASLYESLPPRPPSTKPIVSSSETLDILASFSRSSIPPPPYHTVVSERPTHHPSPLSPPYPYLPQTPPAESSCQRGRQGPHSSSASGSTRRRGRARPPLPIGPRKPSVSGPGQVLRVDRNGSVSSVGSSDPTGSLGPLWCKLRGAASKPPPKFRPPPPKWRGLTLEAAQWTFTSAQLQEMVTKAIQQASEGSSLRLLRLDVLEGEIADETHRLELQHTDIKAQYKALVRKRWMLMAVLAGHVEGMETNNVTTASHTVEELAEVLLALDHLADKLHETALRLAQLKGLRDAHNAGALAMAVRKINGLFVRQMAEKERLHDQVDTLQTERDEAWKHAEDIALDYDALSDRMSETACASGDTGKIVDVQSFTSSKRSTRILTVRKSSARLSQAGLRARKHKPNRSSGNSTRPASLILEGLIPPVPRLLMKPLSAGSATLSDPSGVSNGSPYTTSPTSEALALAEAQREVYEMLGLSLPPSQASSRRRTLSDPDHPSPFPRSADRPMSELLDTTRIRQSEKWRRFGGDWTRSVSSSSLVT